jgi:hypothetical protein
MSDLHPERRRYIRSRADIEFQLARITLALSRAPLVRHEEMLAWFEEAAAGLLERSADEHRDYVEERVASVRETFFQAPRPGYRIADLRPAHSLDAARGGTTRLQ